MVRGSILSRLAGLATEHARAVLALAFVLAVLAAILGAGVGNRLDPYDASDPGSQSAKAVAEIERVSGIEPSAGLLALVRAPGGVYRPTIRAKVRRIERVMRADPAVGRVEQLSRRRGSVTGLAPGHDDRRCGPASPRVREGPPGCREGARRWSAGHLRGDARRDRRQLRRGQSDGPAGPASRRALRPADPDGPLAVVLPRGGRGAIAPDAGRGGDPVDRPRPASRERADPDLGLHAQPGERPWPRPGDRLQPADRLALPRGAGRPPRRCSRGAAPDDADRGADGLLQLDDGGRRAGLAAGLPAALLSLDGAQRRDSRAAEQCIGAAGAARVARSVGRSRRRAGAGLAAALSELQRPTDERGLLVPASEGRDAPTGAHRAHGQRGDDRARAAVRDDQADHHGQQLATARRQRQAGERNAGPTASRRSHRKPCRS